MAGNFKVTKAYVNGNELVRFEVKDLDTGMVGTVSKVELVDSVQYDGDNVINVRIYNSGEVMLTSDVPYYAVIESSRAHNRQLSKLNRLERDIKSAEQAVEQFLESTRWNHFCLMKIIQRTYLDKNDSIVDKVLFYEICNEHGNRYIINDLNDFGGITVCNPEPEEGFVCETVYL